jgi:hypothetical protein
LILPNSGTLLSLVFPMSAWQGAMVASAVAAGLLWLVAHLPPHEHADDALEMDGAAGVALPADPVWRPGKKRRR